jgi:hypothetical protein
MEIRSLRDDLARMAEDNRKLREDLLPLIKVAKDRSQPLPTPEEAPEPKSAGLSRKFSTKRLFLSNSGPKNPSPTTIQEGRPLYDGSSLDPSAAAVAASTHLTASMRDGPMGSPRDLPQHSPTSPGYNLSAPSSGGPTSRQFARNDNSEYAYGSLGNPPLTAISIPSLAPNLSNPSANSITTPPTSAPSGNASTPNPQVEIFKSFRVSIDDPCHKVLPVALKKYNITADWRQYALYIVHGDQERCLGLNERPLILFKQLDKEGRKPMFMLRKHAAPAEGHVSVGGGPPQSVGPNGGALPGGVL